MKVGKPKSKRTPVRLRHKIQKASSAKQRKQRKDAKTNPQWQSRLKKDPGIPNLFPYKAKVLAEIEESKRRREEEQTQKRELAKARREGRAVDAKTINTTQTADRDDELIDDDEGGGVGILSGEEDTEMEIDTNPMAALLASAQARAKSFGQDDGGGDLDSDGEEEDEEEEDDWQGLGDGQPLAKRKALPKRALEDPVKGVTLLTARMEDTPNGIQHLLDHYQLPPIVASGNDLATRMLVEVARKRGRLGRGGIPNMHAAALIVLTDIHEDRLQLPSATTASQAASKGDITIVKTMAAPFKLEGLWGDDDTSQTTMAVDA